VNTKKDWTKVTLFVVLALASLSSVALTAPHGDLVSLLAAPVCGVDDVGHFEQYAAAIDWAEYGGELPSALLVSCEEGNLDLVASRTDFRGESWDRFEQYGAAIDWAEYGGELPLVLSASPGPKSWAPFEQYIAPLESVAHEQFEERFASLDSLAEVSWAPFERYIAPLESVAHEQLEERFQ
jgi:hypothetical protein